METNLHFKQEFLGCPPPHPCEQCKKMQYWLLIHRGVPNLSPLKSRHEPKVLAQNKTRQSRWLYYYFFFSFFLGGGAEVPQDMFCDGVFMVWRRPPRSISSSVKGRPLIHWHFLNLENGPSHNFLHSTHPCLPFIGGGGRAVIDRSVNKSNRLSLSTTSSSKIQNIARFEMKVVSIAFS